MKGFVSCGVLLVCALLVPVFAVPGSVLAQDPGSRGGGALSEQDPDSGDDSGSAEDVSPVARSVLLEEAGFESESGLLQNSVSAQQASEASESDLVVIPSIPNDIAAVRAAMSGTYWRKADHQYATPETGKPYPNYVAYHGEDGLGSGGYLFRDTCRRDGTRRYDALIFATRWRGTLLLQSKTDFDCAVVADLYDDLVTVRLDGTGESWSFRCDNIIIGDLAEHAQLYCIDYSNVDGYSIPPVSFATEDNPTVQVSIGSDIVASLAPDPSSYSVGESQDFTVRTNHDEDIKVVLNATGSGEGRLGFGDRCSVQGDVFEYHDDESALTLTGCREGMTTIRLFRTHSSGIELLSAEYNVMVNPPTYPSADVTVVVRRDPELERSTGPVSKLREEMVTLGDWAVQVSPQPGAPSACSSAVWQPATATANRKGIYPWPKATFHLFKKVGNTPCTYRVTDVEVPAGSGYYSLHESAVAMATRPIASIGRGGLGWGKTYHVTVAPLPDVAFLDPIPKQFELNEEKTLTLRTTLESSVKIVLSAPDTGDGRLAFGSCDGTAGNDVERKQHLETVTLRACSAGDNGLSAIQLFKEGEDGDIVLWEYIVTIGSPASTSVSGPVPNSMLTEDPQSQSELEPRVYLLPVPAVLLEGEATQFWLGSQNFDGLLRAEYDPRVPTIPPKRLSFQESNVQDSCENEDTSVTRDYAGGIYITGCSRGPAYIRVSGWLSEHQDAPTIEETYFTRVIGPPGVGERDLIISEALGWIEEAAIAYIAFEELRFEVTVRLGQRIGQEFDNFAISAQEATVACLGGVILASPLILAAPTLPTAGVAVVGGCASGLLGSAVITPILREILFRSK